jgi:hypothetical protein
MNDGFRNTLVVMREKILYLGGMFAIFVAVGILISLGVIDLPSFWTQVAATLVPTGLVLGCLAFRTEINNWIKSMKGKDIMQNKIEITVTVTQVLGSPVRTDDDAIQYYDTRDQLPSFREQMNFAKKKVRMSALTFTILRLNHEHVLRETAARKVHMTFLLLDPSSTEVERQTKLYKGSEDLREQIKKSLDMLCRLKRDYPNQIVIRTYKVLNAASITVIDKTLAKEEIRKVDSDANSRPNKIAFWKDNKRFFNNISRAYDSLLKNSEEYRCEKDDSNSV